MFRQSDNRPVVFTPFNAFKLFPVHDELMDYRLQEFACERQPVNSAPALNKHHFGIGQPQFV